MSIELAILTVLAVSLIGNRIFSLLTGLILKVPAQVLLPVLCTTDMVQIPLYYWVYENGSTLLTRLPARIRNWFASRKAPEFLSRRTASLGGLGVFIVASLPTFGGGMWSAVFLAYGLHIRKRWSYILIGLGSLVGYLVLYWLLNAVVQTLFYYI